MGTQLSPFAAALRADMADLSINPRMLGQRIGITQQAVVTPLPEDEARAGESLALAEQLGIEVWVCRNGTELAERVRDAEGYDSELQLEDELA